jgi:hypothetical protein
LEGPVSRQRSRWHRAAPASTTASADRENHNMNSNKMTERREEHPIRWDLVERVRREIAEGSYDTPEKMEIALDRLLAQLDKD